MFRKFMKGLLLVFGLLFIIGGIWSFFDVANGGMLSLPFVRPRISTASKAHEYSGAGGLLMAVFLTLMGIWMVSAIRNKQTTEKPSDNEQQPSEPEFCTWWKAEDGWHCEHNPIPTMEYPDTHHCPLCGKEIRVIEVYNDTEK